MGAAGAAGVSFLSWCSFPRFLVFFLSCSGVFSINFWSFLFHFFSFSGVLPFFSWCVVFFYPGVLFFVFSRLLVFSPLFSLVSWCFLFSFPCFSRCSYLSFLMFCLFRFISSPGVFPFISLRSWSHFLSFLGVLTFSFGFY